MEVKHKRLQEAVLRNFFFFWSEVVGDYGFSYRFSPGLAAQSNHYAGLAQSAMENNCC